MNLAGQKSDAAKLFSRRAFLQVGGLALGGVAGLGLPQLVEAQSKSRAPRRAKSVISVFLAGGLSHHDTFDMKPAAPTEVRGEFKPIDTNLPGVQICELLPQTARILDKLVVIRSIVGMMDEHSSFQNLTGYRMNETLRDGHPNVGSVVARVLGPNDPVVPAYVDLYPEMKFKPYNAPGPGKLGRAYAGLKVDGEDVANMKLQFVSHERFASRLSLQSTLGQYQRRIDDAQGMDTLYRQAYEVLSASKLVEAMDLAREDPRLRDRYGYGSPEVPAGGGPLWNEQLLAARRLVEAGARCVTVAYGGWDTHKHNFQQLKKDLPLFDQGLSALVEDIHLRDMADDVLVVVWGEFGRTPKINADAGRDHWAPVNGCLLAGAVQGGQVIGSSDPLGAAVKDRPIHYLDVFATVYRHLGIDPHALVTDTLGRPAPILPESARPIRDVLSGRDALNRSGGSS